ncbi:flippase [Clostridiaceae bacterium]|nr:flippase [Clostridiaceae bacterium]RKI17421.1 flippase [bacterium 1XD21-70]
MSINDVRRMIMPENNTLIKNSLFNVIYKVLNVIFLFVTSMYISRILLADGIGAIAAAQNSVKYFTYFAALGIPTYGIKKIAEKSKEKDTTSKTFSELFIINAISTTFCLVAYYMMFLPISGNCSDLYFVTGFSILLNYINVDWFYQGMEQYKYIMLRNTLVKFGSLILIVVCVRSRKDFVLYALILALTVGANNFFNIIHIWKLTSFTIKELCFKQHLKPIFVLLGASVAVEVYTLADVSLLDLFHSEENIGYYSNAFKCVSVLRTVIVAVCAVFLPRLSNYYASGRMEEFKELIKKGIGILFFLTVPVAVGVILLSDYFIVLMFGFAFEPAGSTLAILSVSIISVAISNFVGSQVLITIGSETIMLKSTIIGAIANICLNCALLLPLKQDGVAIASVVTELFVSIYQTRYIIKNKLFSINKNEIISIIAASLIMSFIVICLKVCIHNSIFCLSLSVCIGALAYGGVALMMKNESALLLISAVKKQIKK